MGGGKNRATLGCGDSSGGKALAKLPAQVRSLGPMWWEEKTDSPSRPVALCAVSHSHSRLVNIRKIKEIIIK